MTDILAIISKGNRRRDRSLCWNLKIIYRRKGKEGVQEAILTFITQMKFSEFRIIDVPVLRSDKKYMSRILINDFREKQKG